MTIDIEVTMYVDDSPEPEVRHWELLKFGDGQYERSLYVRYSFKDKQLDAFAA